MTKLEQIVRPYVSGPIRPASPIGLQNAPKAPNMTPVVWGGSGDNIFTLKAQINQTIPPAKWPDSNEERRTYDVVRVKNPDDPTQYVDTEVMTEYQARNKLDGSRTTLRYATNTNTDTTEVISRGNVRFSGG